MERVLAFLPLFLGANGDFATLFFLLCAILPLQFENEAQVCLYFILLGVDSVKYIVK